MTTCQVAILLSPSSRPAVTAVLPSSQVSVSLFFRLCDVAFLCLSLQNYQQGDIIRAAVLGDVKDLEQCINLGANVDEQDILNGDTALMLAATKGHKAAVEFLISRKANVNKINKYGQFSLYFAAYYGHKGVCDVLLKAGADTTIDCARTTAAEWAAEKGHKELAAFIDSWKQQVRCCGDCLVYDACVRPQLH